MEVVDTPPGARSARIQHTNSGRSEPLHHPLSDPLSEIHHLGQVTRMGVQEAGVRMPAWDDQRVAWGDLLRGEGEKRDGGVLLCDPAGRVGGDEATKDARIHLGIVLRSNGGVDSGLEVRSGVVIPEAELGWRFSRSSGPGGQSVNTTDSRVELSFDVASTSVLSDVLKARALERLQSRLVDGVVTIAASEFKSQWRNREAARERLAVLLREAIAPPPRKRRPTKPSKASVRRRLDDKKRRSQTKRLRGRPDD
jgi:ribosome-associated protein